MLNALSFTNFLEFSQVFTTSINQSWNFLNNLEAHKIVLFCPFEQFQVSRNIARVEFEQYVEYFMSGVSTSVICFQHLL